jgi:hypothetical protein
LKSQLAVQVQQHEGRLKEYAQLIDIKAARIKKLESQLKEIAYGTKSYRVDVSKFEYSMTEEVEDGGARVELERGQNLLEFNISQVRVRTYIGLGQCYPKSTYLLGTAVLCISICRVPPPPQVFFAICDHPY